MTRAFKLKDLQLILLTTAAQRPDSSIFPVPDSVAEQEVRVRRAVVALLRHGLAEEAGVMDESRAWRDAEGRSIGVIINATGRDAIGPGTQPPAESEAAIISADNPTGSRAGVCLPSAAPVSPGRPAGGVTPREGTKQALVLGLLRRSEGATLDQLVAATNWVPHTTRAALTGLRKNGQAQDIITVVSFAAGLVVYAPWLIVLLAVALVPSFLGEAHFNALSYALSYALS